MNQAGIMKAVCWPDKSDTPLYMTMHGRYDWRYECKCTPEQYTKFTEIISGYFNPDEIDFDYKEE